jgi:hypothetical protein
MPEPTVRRLTAGALVALLLLLIAARAPLPVRLLRAGRDGLEALGRRARSLGLAAPLTSPRSIRAAVPGAVCGRSAGIRRAGGRRVSEILTNLELPVVPWSPKRLILLGAGLT